jgi:hypothetical protein
VSEYDGKQLARRISDPQWRDVETGVARVTERMLSLLPAERSAALLDGPVTVDLDATDVEVYGPEETRYCVQPSGAALRAAACGDVGGNRDPVGRGVVLRQR